MEEREDEEVEGRAFERLTKVGGERGEEGGS